MRIGHNALIKASKEGVVIHGLDGSASIDTCGGAVEVQIQEQTKNLEITSLGGDVVLRVPEQVNGGVHLSAKSQGGITIASPMSMENIVHGEVNQAVSGVLIGVGEESSAHRLFLAEGLDEEGNEVAPAA
eukprot:1122283-Pyramimonas_sp.AAC.1